jgi:TspO/MBR family
LANVATHCLPAPDLARIVLHPAAPEIAAVPLKPAAWIVPMNPAFSPPNGERLARVNAEEIERRRMPLFFGLHRPDLAFLEIMVLWVYPIHSGAALLLVPYLAWVSFAAALNLTVWRLNPSA